MKRTSPLPTSMMDLVFILVLQFMLMLVLAILQINPKTPKNTKKIDIKAKLMITIEWEDNDPNDVDLFVKLPNGQIVFYGNSNVRGASLDRDDRGTYNDTLIVDGVRTVVKDNWENVFVRQIIPGEYTVNLFLFRKSPKNNKPSTVKVKVYRVDPHRLIYSGTVLLEDQKQEETAVSFTMKKNGRIENVNTDKVDVVNQVLMNRRRIP